MYWSGYHTKSMGKEIVRISRANYIGHVANSRYYYEKGLIRLIELLWLKVNSLSRATNQTIRKKNLSQQ